ncbi:copper resistance protein CopC/CopD [Shimazuella sp. AN120528]|uniref:copper resistance CopC/CopD family protein n=1 Tax=Shimazuella soli TaxID=1892854 RepID=UPI001F0E47B5|nr:copper resistance protein CopC [Shimazuella soli]MCH5585777.1 copper resistance protein CopC/CopD [Shimazuella soli]
MPKKAAFLLSLFICFLGFLMPGRVFAHAYLLDSSPKQGETTKLAPNEIQLHFSEQITPDVLSLTVKNPRGQSLPISIKLAPTDPSRVIASLPSLTKGTYTVNWSVISEDGHPVSGSYSFAFGEKVATTAGGNETSHPISTTMLILLRYLNEVWLLVCAGFAWVSFFAEKHQLPVWTEKSNRLIKWISALLWFGFQIAIWFLYASELPQNLLNKWLWQGQFTSLVLVPFAIVLLIQAFLYILLCLPNMVKGWYLTLWVLITATSAFSGHAWSSQSIHLALIVRLFHIWSGALWLGGLTYLLWVCIHYQTKLGETLRKFQPFFSRTAFIAASLLISSGLLLVTVQTDWSKVWTFQTFWSRFLIIKILLVIGMLLYAALQNRHWISTALLERDSLRTEVILGCIALLLGVWMSQIAYPI